MPASVYISDISLCTVDYFHRLGVNQWTPKPIHLLRTWKKTRTDTLIHAMKQSQKQLILEFGNGDRIVLAPRGLRWRSRQSPIYSSSYSLHFRRPPRAFVFFLSVLRSLGPFRSTWNGNGNSEWNASFTLLKEVMCMELLLTLCWQTMQTDGQILARVFGAIGVNPTLAYIALHPLSRCIQIHHELLLSS